MKINYKRVVLTALVVVSLIIAGGYLLNNTMFSYEEFEGYIGANTKAVITYQYDEELIEDITLPRGARVSVVNEKEINENLYYKVIYGEDEEEVTSWLSAESLVLNYEETIYEEELYVSVFTHLKNSEGKILTEMDQNSKLEVISGTLNLDGTVSEYLVNFNGTEGYVPSYYVELAEEDAMGKYELSYIPEKYSHFNFKPRTKYEYENNPIRLDSKAVYLSLHTLTTNFDVDKYIEKYITSTPIDAFVIDVKHDSGLTLFESDTVKSFGTNANSSALSKEDLQVIIDKLKEHDVYLIARVVAFRDNYFAKANPSEAIRNRSNNSVYTYAGSAFVSAHSRLMWEYNVGIAKEAADLGFNEIQFDYVRFSEYVTEAKNIIPSPDFNEDRTQAVQRFLEYAHDELQKKEVYLAADLYGLTSYIDRDSVRLGQYFEAMSTAIDIISPMAYPDHYDSYRSVHDPNGLIRNPAKEHERLMKYYTMDLIERNNKLENPANIRMWIKGYHNSYRDSAGTIETIPEQVRGLNANGIDGYMLWGTGYEYNTVGIINAHK